MLAATQSTLSRYKNSIKHVQVLDAGEEKKLAIAMKNGDERAKEKLAEALLPFVIHVAKKYRRWGIPLEDIIQQGNIGLLKAIEKYELDKNCRLVTYASYWIRAEIRDYVIRSYRIVRLGTTRTERQAIRMYRRGEVENAKELSEKSGMPLLRAEKLWPLLKARDSSVDATIGDEQFSMLDRMQAEVRDPEEEKSLNDEMEMARQVMKEALSHLSDREKRIVEERSMADKPRTLQDLGEEMGVSKERVRQLEQRAHQKLRKELASFSDLVAA